MRTYLRPALALLVALCALEARAQAPPAAYEPLARLLAGEGKERREASKALVASGDRSLLPGLVDAAFFAPGLAKIDVYQTLEGLSGTKLPRRYHDWVEWLGAQSDIVPKEGYAAWKLILLRRIDPTFERVFYPGAPARIRLEEVVWGGVKLDGIPSLDSPTVVPAAEARYLLDSEAVFGVSLGGAQRAYPVRHLSWHEMANDEVGGEPITLSYCTLCGSAVLYSTRTPNGGRYLFGTSGLLYRSNKLMYDRGSYSLWSNLTGEPVVGRLANAKIELPQLPMTRTTWGEWRRRFPATTVLTLAQEAGKAVEFNYLPGAAERARSGVAFPVWQKSKALERNEEVFALEVGGSPKAYPLEALWKAKVLNDRLGGTALVLVADEASGAVRAYARGERELREGSSRDELTADDGSRWRVDEEALVELGSGERLPRLPGHIAFWFGWYGFYPQTEIYGKP
jgi:hypothetical protein